MLRTRLVDTVRPVTEPEACSPVEGAGFPCGSVPWPSAVQALAPATTVKVQVKSVEAPGARVEAPPVNRPVQTPPPVTLTPVRARSEERRAGQERRSRWPPEH